MKVRMVRLLVGMGLATVGLLLLAGAAPAQNVPAQFIITGKAAEKIQDFSTINLATAQRIAESCEKAATAQGVQISIIVLDKDGNHVYFDRMDGQGYLNIITAEMKARTALMTRAPSKLLMNRAIQDPPVELQFIQIGEFANSGGLPIAVNNQMIGFVGVGGSAPKPPVWSDEICGHKALQEVFGDSVPPLAQDLPARGNGGGAKVPVPQFKTAAAPKSTLPADYVLTGKAASNVFDGNQISLAAAKKIAEGCREWAASKGGSASIYVLDNAGEFVHMERMDGQMYNNIRTALLKAQTSLKTRQPTSAIGANLKNNPAMTPRQTTYFNLFWNAGGVPIVVDGQMIGAVGVGGGGEQIGGDEKCAVEGLKAAFGDHVTLPVYPAASTEAAR
ncbi:MAG TPA: heme-binding protein [Candidatus Acidoferrales bacterium]|nr:heme-binding protein [Candidatus Acidoferrales bacterium]